MSANKIEQNEGEEIKLNDVIFEDKKLSNRDENSDGTRDEKGNKDEDDDQNFIKKRWR